MHGIVRISIGIGANLFIILWDHDEVPSGFTWCVRRFIYFKVVYIVPKNTLFNLD